MLRVHSIPSTLAGSLVLALLTGCGGPATRESPQSVAVSLATPGTAPPGRLLHR